MDSVAKLLNTPIFTVVCRLCNKDAFFLPGDPNGKPLRDSGMYKFGETWMTPEQIDKISMCPACGRRIDVEKDLIVSKNNNRIKNLFMFYQFLSGYVKASKEIREMWLRLLPYKHFLCMTEEEWIGCFKQHDKFAENAEKQARAFADRCIRLGCEAQPSGGGTGSGSADKQD